MSKAVETLRTRLSELIALRNASHLLHWDQQTKMPPHGGKIGRASCRERV